MNGGAAFIANSAGGASLSSTSNSTPSPATGGRAGQGGNFNVQSGSALDLGESIIAGGVAGGGAADCSGSLNSLGYNLIDDSSCGMPAGSDIIGQSPQLGALASNGGRRSPSCPPTAVPP